MGFMFQTTQGDENPYTHTVWKWWNVHVCIHSYGSTWLKIVKASKIETENLVLRAANFVEPFMLHSWDILDVCYDRQCGSNSCCPGVWFFVQYPDKYFHASTFMPAYSNQGVFFFSYIGSKKRTHTHIYIIVLRSIGFEMGLTQTWKTEYGPSSFLFCLIFQFSAGHIDIWFISSMAPDLGRFDLGPMWSFLQIYK